MKKYIAAVIIGITMFSCQNKEVEEVKIETSMEEEMNSRLVYEDHHSFSKPNEAFVTHLSWTANVDFEEKVIVATAKYQIKNNGGDKIHLDSRNLNVSSITRSDSEGDLEFESIDHDEDLGTEIVIPITSKTEWIAINYSTTKGADALQFLNPTQTAGKKHPFLFTQSQAILARTWIPCQDSPGIRFTYDAEVTVPKGMLALMSATNPTEINETGVYNFKMDQPVPSYLMALSVGNIEYRKLGEVTGVYAEPEIIESAAYEFADMQHMVDTAAALYGEYRWGKYDVIVLPPSFPFGGMENPRLTFATPTIIAGDRSLTALIAHELAHSWSGNLVTNATWDDIWLNEGFTVYFENRIMEEIFGEDFSNMLALLSYQDLQDELEWLKSEGRESDTRLRVDLEGRNPDDGLTGVPYDKGFYFLKLIEQTVGKEKMDAFLKEYFAAFAFKVMTTDAFMYYLDEKLLSQDSTWTDIINPEAWVFGMGLPENCPIIKSNKFEMVEAQLALWSNGNAANTLESKEWMTPEWMHFVRQLPKTLTTEQMADLDAAFGFTDIGNSEIQAAWFEKVIPNNYKAADAATEEFLIRVGRRKFLTPIYKAIINSEAGVERARAIYTKARPNYHAVSSATLDDLLEVEG